MKNKNRSILFSIMSALFEGFCELIGNIARRVYWRCCNPYRCWWFEWQTPYCRHIGYPHNSKDPNSKDYFQGNYREAVKEGKKIGGKVHSEVFFHPSGLDHMIGEF